MRPRKRKKICVIKNMKNRFLAKLLSIACRAFKNGKNAEDIRRTRWPLFEFKLNRWTEKFYVNEKVRRLFKLRLKWCRVHLGLWLILVFWVVMNCRYENYNMMPLCTWNFKLGWSRSLAVHLTKNVTFTNVTCEKTTKVTLKQKDMVMYCTFAW